WKMGYDIRTRFSDRNVYEGGFIGKAAKEAMKDSPICLTSSLDKYTHWISAIEMAQEGYQKKQLSEEMLCEIVQMNLPHIDVKAADFMEKFISKNINDNLESMIRKSCQEVEIPKRDIK